MTVTRFGPEGWTPEHLGSLAGRTYVITGANAGAGFEATRVFLSRGARVVMLNRNPDKSSAAIAALKQEFGSDADVAFVRMDLAVLDSVRGRRQRSWRRCPASMRSSAMPPSRRWPDERSPWTGSRASSV